MSTPQQWLDEILEATEALQKDETLNHQQVTFVKIIHSNAERFLELLGDAPQNQPSLRRILVPSHEINVPPTSIVGYAQMLLEHPEQFGIKEITEFQHQQLSLIFNNGNKIRDWTQSIYDAAQTERQEMHNAPPQATNLNQFLEDYVPLYQYFLKENPIELIADIPPNLPFVMANPYHLSYLLQHIIGTIVDELIEEGIIHLLATTKDNAVIITIASDALELTKDALVTLFEKQGRHIYRERLEAQGGKLSILSASTIAIHLTKS